MRKFGKCKSGLLFYPGKKPTSLGKGFLSEVRIYEDVSKSAKLG
jgi:hypothetical protein